MAQIRDHCGAGVTETIEIETEAEDPERRQAHDEVKGQALLESGDGGRGRMAAQTEGVDAVRRIPH